MLEIVLFILLAFAPVPTAPTAQDTNALVESLQRKYDRLSTLSTDFIQVHTAPGERTRRETGKLLLKKPGKMRWDYATPAAKLFLSDGKNIFEYVPSEGMATRVPVKESDDMRAPFMFLLGRGNLRRDFRRIEDSNEAPAQSGNRVLKFIPKRTSMFQELFVEVQPASLKIARLTIVESSGARSDFIFSNLEENVAITDDRFTFKAPPGVRVVSVEN